DDRNIGIGGAAVSRAQPLSPVSLWRWDSSQMNPRQASPKGAALQGAWVTLRRVWLSSRRRSLCSGTHAHLIDKAHSAGAKAEALLLARRRPATRSCSLSR